ncbi:MAG TPA: EamA family transporter [Steroidobacteraceae bacterium]|jgi:drug/metabolite transporter (DMT)-like permease
MKFEYLCVAVVAVFWGGYPLVARSAGIGAPIGALVMTFSGLVTIAAATAWQGVAVRPSLSEFVKLGVAGIMMGIGLLAFNAVANSRRFDASVSIPIMDTTMLLATVMAAIVFFGEPITVKKVAGIGLLLAGILVLKPE